MRRHIIKRLLGIAPLPELDENTLYEIHWHIEEPRAADRIASEFGRSVKRKRIRKNFLGYILIWGNDFAFEWKCERISGPKVPFDKADDEKRKYRFLIDERMYFKKRISRPSLGLSPPEPAGSNRPSVSACPDIAVRCHRGLANSAREFNSLITCQY